MYYNQLYWLNTCSIYSHISVYISQATSSFCLLRSENFKFSHSVHYKYTGNYDASYLKLEKPATFSWPGFPEVIQTPPAGPNLTYRLLFSQLFTLRRENLSTTGVFKL